MGTRLDSDDFEMIMGPADEKQYAAYADELIMEFSHDGVKGVAVGQGMMMKIPMGRVLVLGVLLPYGFPVKRPVISLVEPDPATITHDFIDKNGVVTHVALKGWKAPKPLAVVVRKIFTDLAENPPRVKAAKIDWGLPSGTEEVEVKFTPKIAAGVEIEAEAAPSPVFSVVPAAVRMVPATPSPFPSLSEKSNDTGFAPPKMDVIIKKNPVTPTVPTIPSPPTFNLGNCTLAALQRLSNNPSELLGEYKGKLSEVESKVVGGGGVGRLLEKMNDEVLLAKTRQSDLEMRLAAVREELLIAKICKTDIETRLESTVLVEHLKTTLAEHQANLQAVETEYDRTKQQTYLESIYYPVAYEYHIANIKYNQIIGGQ